MDKLEKRLKQAIQECERLKKENQQLKTLLIKHNIQLVKDDTIHNTHDFSISKEQKINERIELFRSLFNGRTDLFAVRWESKNGRSGYSPACAYEWQPPICQKPTIKCANCTFRKFLPLTNQVIYNHLIGKRTIGLYPLLQDETCWFLAVDFDKNNWQQDVKAFIESCKELNVPASIERSRSGNGGHVWIFLQQATPAALVRKLGHVLLSRTLSRRYELGMESFDRLFPNQDTLPKGGFGNLIALPLQNGPRKSGNSVFIDDQMIPYPDQWLYLKHVRKMSLENIKQIVQSYFHNDDTQSFVKEDTLVENKLPIKISITEKNGLYIEKDGLSSGFIQKLIQLTTFNNPAFF
ncbi:TOTE conflict system archaeo-eukaryotic primase domain-containing protein [Lysinibacillus sp. 54212]|uniref:TOTE conflict system archaeo-eukaryotic primase domain-containing protein n=1 Tax=Lysinibacillus sp. 54212 TaxID=3119829 RepID=UPI002FC92830